MTEIVQTTQKWHESVLVKSAIIAVITLTLLIPSVWIQDLVDERDGYHEQIMKSVSEKWAGSQLIQSPLLAIPYKKQITETGSDNKTITREVIETAYILPEVLNIKAGLKTSLFQHGVTDVTVYTADVLVQGSFNKPDLSKLGIGVGQILYDKTKLLFSISDLRGLKNAPIVNIQGQDYTTSPVYDGNTPYGKGLQVDFILPKDGPLKFSYPLNIKGSNELKFLQTGKETTVEMSSSWNSPEFTGRYLPDSRAITSKGFNAKWHMLNYSSPFPRQWVHNDTLLTNKIAMDEAVSGVKLSLAITQYHEVLRTTKYSSLIIFLTFVSLFFTELICRIRIHLFNYTLIGAALVVYYTLLLSFAEQVGYNWAYLIASVATIGLVALFTSSLLKNRVATLIFTLAISIFYAFIYVIIQLEELSLMVGSIALFLIIAGLMFFSRRIDWDRH